MRTSSNLLWKVPTLGSGSRMTEAGIPCVRKRSARSPRLSRARSTPGRTQRLPEWRTPVQGLPWPNPARSRNTCLRGSHGRIDERPCQTSGPRTATNNSEPTGTPPSCRAHPCPNLDPDHLALLARQRALKPGPTRRPLETPGPRVDIGLLKSEEPSTPPPDSQNPCTHFRTHTSRLDPTRPFCDTRSATDGRIFWRFEPSDPRRSADLISADPPTTSRPAELSEARSLPTWTRRRQ